MKPLIVLNFKTYNEATGLKALPLAQKIAKSKKNKYDIIVAPSLLTTKEIVDKTTLTVFAQHTDNVQLGAHTGRIPAKELVDIGVKGTLLNHSERKVPYKFLTKIVKECRKNKLQIIICASSISEVKKVAQLKPEYLAYEPTELIGGDVSVCKAQPDILVTAVNAVKKISRKTKVLCGAGVHNKEDLGQALVLGMHGVLIGHAVPKAKDPKKFLQELMI
jgi:triosephosphate isomerase (TIM)